MEVEEESTQGKEDKEKRKYACEHICPLLGFKVIYRLIGKKEDTAGSSTFPQNKVRRREVLGRGDASPM